ncbi:glycosyltransferase family 2 protein [Mobilicoccus caccae]|uniref:Glycosyl transferase n=1 Tax=Mobilicoccus caccae TaxID=1859295 RepID=A0ABQ6IQZ9_9MICO|nr:glycosyltransferase family A protein [Mobilicoccus caccae]GMA39108.1 glycosyl transferase [Mobilicoccus caccae]
MPPPAQSSTGATRPTSSTRARHPRTPEALTPAEPRLPGIAVVIPCHNYAEFIGAAITSVLDQTRPYSQVIVVDDGSTDDSLDVIRRYADHLEIVAQENTGLLGACLAGLARVQAEYVHFLDADDTADPHLVEKCAPLLASTPVKLQFQLAAIDEEGEPNGSVFPSFADGYDRAAMQEDNRVIGFYQCPPTSGNVFHTATLRGLGLEAENPRLPLDGAGCAVMPYLGEIVSVSEPLGGYRVHGSSMSNTQLAPSPEQCTREIADFEANWEVAARLMGQSEPPYGEAMPLFLLERHQLRRALSGGSPDVVGLARYLGRLRQSNLPTWQQAAQGLWMTTLITPSTRARTRLVHLRRSGAARPQWMRRLVRLVRR